MTYRNVGQSLADCLSVPTRAAHLREDGHQSVRLPLGGDSRALGGGGRALGSYGQALLQPDGSLLQAHRGGSPGEQEASRRGGRGTRRREGDSGRGSGRGILIVVACKDS